MGIEEKMMLGTSEETTPGTAVEEWTPAADEDQINRHKRSSRDSNTRRMKRKREMEKRAKKLRRRLRQRHLRLGNKRHRDNYDYKAARSRHDVMQNDERSVGLSRKTLGIKQG